MRFTRKIVAAIQKAEYENALFDGRVVRYNQGSSFRSFHTVADADAFVVQIKTFVPEDDAVRIRHVYGEC